MYSGYIYLLTNIQNGKQYIGQTTQNIEYYHKKQLRDGRTSRLSRVLNSAIKKHGVHNFQRTILETLIRNTKDKLKKQLNAKEIYYIEKYNTYNNGYNMTKGGDKGNVGYHHSEETKKKISNISKQQKNRNITAMQLKNIENGGVHNKIKFSDHDISQIIKMRFKFKSTNEISKKYNCTRSPIIKILKKYYINGISLGDNNFCSYYKYLQFADLIYKKYYIENHTMEAIKRQYNISIKIIRKNIKEYQNGICSDNSN